MTVTGETSINGSMKKLGIASKCERRITAICTLLLAEVLILTLQQIISLQRNCSKNIYTLYTQHYPFLHLTIIEKSQIQLSTTKLFFENSNTVKQMSFAICTKFKGHCHLTVDTVFRKKSNKSDGRRKQKGSSNQGRKGKRMADPYSQSHESHQFEFA